MRGRDAIAWLCLGCVVSSPAVVALEDCAADLLERADRYELLFRVASMERWIEVIYSAHEHDLEGSTDYVEAVLGARRDFRALPTDLACWTPDELETVQHATYQALQRSVSDGIRQLRNGAYERR